MLYKYFNINNLIYGGAGSLERTSLSLYFPANREFNREILRFWVSRRRGAAWHATRFTVLNLLSGTIEAQKEQGFFLRHQGIEIPY
jgi:hypothetical protein